MKKMIRCKRCGGSNIEYLARVDINTDKIINDFDLDGVKCDSCGVIEVWELDKLDECEHNNTITNECSDCNEQELIDGHHKRVLRESLIEVSNICCDVLGDIVYEHCEGYKDFIEIVEENVTEEIYNRLNYEYKCIKDNNNEK